MTGRPPALDDVRVLRGFLTARDLATLTAQIIPALPADAWLAGRQGTGYHKCPLRAAMPPALDDLVDRSTRALAVPVLDWDCYLLRYPHGTRITPHTDPTDAHRHLRLNAVIQAGRGGGVLSVDGRELPLQVGDAVVFRPDLVDHAVSAVDGERYVWSVGCVF